MSTSPATINADYAAIQYTPPFALAGQPLATSATPDPTLFAQYQGESAAQVISLIEGETYTLATVDAVIREYQAAFNTVPDQAGVAYWVHGLDNGSLTLGNLSVAFANSTQFGNLYGGANATTPASIALVEQLYVNVLGRPGDAAGVAYWASSGLNAAQLLQAFAQSGEFTNDTAANIIQYQNLEAAGTPPLPPTSLLSLQPATLTLTTGIDTPPAYSSAVANAVFFAPDVLVAGAYAPTLNPGDNLVDTALLSTATLSILTSAGALSHTFAGFVTTGIPNVLIENSGGGPVIFDGTGAAGLTNITSLNDAATFGGAITLNNIENQVALGVTGPISTLHLNYAHALPAGAPPQALDLTNATQFDGTAITFGTNASASLAVSLTGSSHVNIFDASLTNIVVTNTDTGQTNTLNFSDGANNTIANADFSAATGALTVAFLNDDLANGSLIKLGANDTLTVGQSNNAGHTTDSVNVAGDGGVYSIFAGNQNDFINLGAHGTGDTLTFIQPNVGALATVTNPNLVTDSYNFSIAGFNGGTASTNATTPLLTFGDFTANAAITATPGAISAFFYTPNGAAQTTNVGESLIVDQSAVAKATAAAVIAPLTGDLGFVVGPVIFSNAAHPAGGILIAYQGTDGVHIAVEGVTAAQTNTSAVAGTTIHDIVDLVGQNISSFNATTVSHMHLVA